MTSSLSTAARRQHAPSRIRPLAALARMAVLTGFPLCGAAFAQTATAPATPTEQALPAVTVSAAVTPDDQGQQLEKRVSSGALGSRSQLDTPFSTTIVSGEQLADRAVTKLGDVFALDASVSDNSNANNSWSAYLTVRGMQLDWQNAFRVNGMPYVGYGITLPYEQLEQVELLKGSTAFMYGFATPGGAINYVTKKPTEQFTASLELGYRSAHVWSEHIDIGGRAGPDKMFGYRLNVTHEEGKPSNAVGMNRDSVSLSLDARITRDLTWTFDGLYTDRRNYGQTPTFATYSLPAGQQLPGVVSGRGGLYAGPDQHMFNNLQLYSTGLRYNLNPDWTVSTNYSFSKVSRSRNETSLVLTDSLGNYDDFRYDGTQAHQFSQWTTMVEGKFRTGPFSHQLVGGVSWQQQIDRYSIGTDKYFQLGTGNLALPYTGVYYSQGGMSEYRASDISQKAVFLSDTVQLTEKWSVLGGLRYTNFEQNNYDRSGTTTSTYSKNGVLSPTIAVMFKPMPSTTLYASYVESLEPGQQVTNPAYSNFGQQLNPIRSKQYEIGAKTDQGKWTGTAALFRVERGAQYASNGFFAQDGLEIYQGIELDSYARLGQFDLTGSAMYLDSWYARGAANNGNRVAGAPNFVLAGSLGYRVPFVPGLRVGVDGKYTSTTKLRPAGDVTLGGYTVFNLGATYNTRVGGKDLTLRAALTNLTNKRYWGFQYADYVQPADPRAISLSAKISY
ncbi:TonB-dependent siderophore receptor [Cupriavidus sp. YR651]|uniref:TonB-dependent siderophore receptor n=1 Tax=Cupriavidus sp. YR651 TaxID=1855315 RepID=UPI000B82CE21|nr:TonB-dependent receptor [Cupriavidus sp. YR651]